MQAVKVAPLYDAMLLRYASLTVRLYGRSRWKAEPCCSAEPKYGKHMVGGALPAQLLPRLGHRFARLGNEMFAAPSPFAAAVPACKRGSDWRLLGPFLLQFVSIRCMITALPFLSSHFPPASTLQRSPPTTTSAMHLSLVHVTVGE